MAPSWRKNAEYWKQLPRRSALFFLAAVFCLFASFSFILGELSVGQPNLTPNICLAMLGGFCGALYAFTGARRMLKSLAAVGCFQAIAIVLLSSAFSQGKVIPALQLPSLKIYALFNAVAAIILLVIAYWLFLIFFSMEGGRYYGTLTEMRLAGEIHRSLVPEIRTAVPPFDFYGRSWPSGEVSGDLVDLVQNGEAWFAYVADVSGHGVPAGVLMTMVKSAVRTRLAAAGPDGVLAALNDILLPLSEPNMYVTFAFLSGTARALQFATAGHVPILHYEHASGSVHERSVNNFPLALMNDVPFEVAETASGPGDVFVILTDGITEIADARDRELGLEPLKTVLLENAAAPLSELADQLRQRAIQQGKQIDDQTLLLIRCSTPG